MLKIESITLQDFMGHKSIEISFRKKVTGIFGGNGSGKSSIRDAMLYALTGLCRNARLKKDLHKITNRDGAKKASVSLSLFSPQNTAIIKRTQIPSGQNLEIIINDEPVAKSPSDLEKEIETIFGVSQETIKFAFDGCSYMDMKPKERKEFLQQIIGLSETADISGFLSEFNISEIPATIQPLINTGNFPAITKLAVDQRRMYKRELEEIESQVSPSTHCKIITIGSNNLDIDQIDFPKIQAVIEKARETRDKIIEQTGAAGAIKSINIENLNQTLEEYRETLKTKPEILAQKQKNESDILAIDKKIAAQKTKQQKLMDEISKLHGDLNILNAKTAPDTCPL